ncbi:hypothetical protein P4B35_06475 [Pontiellaceae bacterium B12227]|nr:hypothetical protein [Pontiellaceae bacterium B12227]
MSGVKQEFMMQDSDQNLANTIGMLEQILEVMPQDVDALKALYNANFQNGNERRSFEYLNRLVDVAAGASDPDLFGYLVSELPKFEQSYPSEVAESKTRIKTLFGAHRISQGISESTKAAEPQPAPQKSEVDISGELALAWRLYEENQLSQDEYSTVLHDLTEVSSKELDVPISVLHVLTDRGFTNITRIMLHVSNRSGVPFISLDNFQLDQKAVESLELDYPAHEGALPFGFVGNDLMVGMLNPFNSELIDRVETASGHRCHAFLVEPADYDAALIKLRDMLKAA